MLIDTNEYAHIGVIKTLLHLVHRLPRAQTLSSEFEIPG